MTQEIDKQIYQEGSDFLSQSRAKSGETIYLRMELITPQNQPYIRQYVSQVTSHVVAGTSHRAGLLSYLSRYIEPTGEDSFALTAQAHLAQPEKKDSPLDFIREASGFSDEELLHFIHHMGHNGFHVKNANRPELHETVSGAYHLYTGLDAYFVYASKNPHFSIRNTQLSDEQFTLKEFISQYQDLLICVGSSYSAECSSSRGIFRNPITAIEDSYKGIAIALLGFSGAVAEKFLNKTTTRIRPVGRMPGILYAALKKDEFTVYEMNGEEVRKEAEKKNAFFEDNPFTIQLKAMTRIFKASQRSDVEIMNNRIAEEKQQLVGKNQRYTFFKVAGLVSAAAASVYLYCHSTNRFRF